MARPLPVTASDASSIRSGLALMVIVCVPILVPSRLAATMIVSASSAAASFVVVM